MKNKRQTEPQMILYIAMITSFLTTFTGSALNLSIPDMGAELQAGAELIGWMVTAYTVAVAALSIPLGRVADLTDRRKMLIGGIFLFGISSLLSVFLDSIQLLIAVRVVQGIGGAMIFATNTAMLVGAFPGEERGKVLGYSIACTYIGLSVGPVLGGICNDQFGWRSIFILTFAVSFLTFLLAWKKLPVHKQEKEGGSLDWWGSILCGTIVVTFLCGLSFVSESWIGPIAMVVGILLFFVFIKHELVVASPVIDVRLFMENKGYAFSNLAALLNYGATFAISYLLAIYLQVVVGYSSRAAGLILIVQPVIMAILSPLMGRLSDKISPYKLSSFGMGLCAIGLAMFACVAEHTALWVIVIALIISGVGFAFFSSPNTNAVMACVEKKDYGVASSLLATMRTIGHSSSMAILTVIVGVYMNGVLLTEAAPGVMVQTMHVGFMVFTSICIVGIFVSMRRK